MDDRDVPILEEAIGEIWDKARELGLDPFPTHFEIVPPAILYEFGAYLLPGRFSHWTHGKAYYTMKSSYDYGLSKIYELVINANPSYAFLLDTNTLLHNKFVVAHVFGHTDFFKHNVWFGPTNRQMVETVSQNAQRIRQYGIEEGSLEVERFLDAVLSISDHIDPFPRRERPKEQKESRPTGEGPHGDLFPPAGLATSLATGRPLIGEPRPNPTRRRVPPEPEKDLLRFLIEHADHLEDWQRDVLAIVREESLYFVPQMQVNGSVGSTGSNVPRLHVEAEVNDIAVLHDVIPALQAEVALIPSLRHAPGGHEVSVSHHLGPDKPALNVGVDLACRLPGGGPLADRPGPHLILADGEKADQPQMVVGGPSQAGDA